MTNTRQAIIALGSNLGDRSAYLSRALDLLADSSRIDRVTPSSIYETDPVGVEDQPPFLNLVAGLRTDLSPEDLLTLLLEIEQQLGRVRTTRWGPRTIDLDLLFYENESRRTPELTLPHPRWEERTFVTIPLRELLRSPEFRKTSWRWLRDKLHTDPPPPDASDKVRKYAPARADTRNITLRDATEADLPAILDIYNESVPTGRATADTQPVTLDQRLEWFRRFDPAKRPIWIALEGDKPVGCIYLSSFYGGRPAYHKTAEISFYIAASHQRRGIGTFMTQRMISACPALGVTTLIAMHFDHNEGTKNLIRHFGFETVGHLPGIAELFGDKRGLLISILRIPPNPSDTTAHHV